ncbi:MAG: hypothetical protein HY264_01640 [Chloroflexi bacterium]|nr:hypothetical protein [Chloroflexota bacterium]
MLAIDRLLVRLLAAAPGRWVVIGGYANQPRRPNDARFTENLGLKIDAAIETAPELLASGFASDLADDHSYDVALRPAPCARRGGSAGYEGDDQTVTRDRSAPHSLEPSSG